MILGNAPLTTGKLVSRITEDYPFQSPDTDQQMFLGRSLERLGISLNYRVIRRELGSVSNAICWWEAGNGVTLIADCCWGVAGEVAAAFKDLMTIKAPMKLLTFRSRAVGFERQDLLLRADIDAVFKSVAASMLDFAQHVEGESYVLLERVDKQAMFRCYEFTVPRSGRLDLRFEEASRVFRPAEVKATAVGAGH